MRLFLFVLLFVCSFSVCAQTDYVLSGAVVKSNNISLNEYGALLLGDSCTFYIVDELGQEIIPDNGNWSFGVEVEQGYYMKVESATSTDYGIRIGELVSDNVGFKRYTVENDSSTYYQGKVTFEGEYQERKIKLDKLFYVNLLPSMPKIKVLDITWSNYDEEWRIYDDAYMTIQVNSCRSEFIYSWEQDVTFEGIILFSLFEANIDAKKGIGVLPFYDGYRCFRFFSGNFSGIVECKDTLYTEKVAMSIPAIQMKDVPFYPNPVAEMLFVQEDMDSVFPVSIYDSKGRLVKYVGVPMRSIDVSNLEEGIYVVSYKDKPSNKIQTFKMLKK